MTVTAYCAQNGINIKTYYYHLRKVRERCLESEPALIWPMDLLRLYYTSDFFFEEYVVYLTLTKKGSQIADRFLAIVFEETKRTRFQRPHNS